MEKKTAPKWGTGKTLIGLFNDPEEKARLIIPQDYTDDSPTASTELGIEKPAEKE